LPGRYSPARPVARSPAGCYIPLARKTFSTSLSPRPDRPTMMRWLFRMAGAARSAQATAWADSSAGMMPSSFVRV